MWTEKGVSCFAPPPPGRRTLRRPRPTRGIHLHHFHGNVVVPGIPPPDTRQNTQPHLSVGANQFAEPDSSNTEDLRSIHNSPDVIQNSTAGRLRVNFRFRQLPVSSGRFLHGLTRRSWYESCPRISRCITTISRWFWCPQPAENSWIALVLQSLLNRHTPNNDTKTLDTATQAFSTAPGSCDQYSCSGELPYCGREPNLTENQRSTFNTVSPYFPSTESLSHCSSLKSQFAPVHTYEDLTSHTRCPLVTSSSTVQHLASADPGAGPTQPGKKLAPLQY